jgi:hypothetical protein
MMNPSSPFAPSFSYGVPPARRPGGLTAVSVIAIVLGVLGWLGSLATIASLAAGPRLQQSFSIPSQGPGSGKTAEIQRTMQQKLQAVNNRHWWPLVGFAMLNVCLATGMLAGGILVLKRTPRAGTLLITVFAVALLFEIARSIFQGFVQWEMAAVMSDFLPRMMEASAPANAPNAPQVAVMGAAIAKASLVVGFAFQLILSVAKLVYYAVGWSYLRRATVRRWLENTGV